jgi:hypothetical protein
MEISSGFDRQSPKDRFGNGFVYPSSVIRGLAALICCRIVRNSKPREPFRYVLGFVFGASFNACAQTPPPDTPFDAMTRTATLEQKPSTTLRMGTLRVQLEQTTLDDVRRAASVGKVTHRGDASESIYWLCYTSSAPGVAQRIWIIAHGEMGGSEHYVTEISAEAISNGHATADCPSLPKRLSTVSLENHLWLGASEAEAGMRMGAPSYRNGHWRSFDFAGKVAGNCPGGDPDLTASLMLHFQNGRVNSLRVSQITSC